MTAPSTVPVRSGSPATSAPDTRWVRTAVGATLTWVAAHVAMMALTREFIPPLAVTSVLGIAIAVFVIRRPVAGAWTAATVAVVHLVVSMRFTLDDIQHPETPPAFMHAVLGVLAMLLAIVAGAAIIRRRRTSPRPLLLATAVLVLTGAVVSTVATLATSSDVAGSEDATLVAEAIAWSDDHVTVPSGGTLYLDNEDLARHTFTVEDTDLDVEMPAGRGVLVHVDLSPGTYAFICDVRGHETMTGTLTVTDGR